MEAVRIRKIVNSDVLPELNNYKGKNVEIIILSNENKKRNIGQLNELIGSCPNLPDGMEFQKKIREAWER